MTEKTPMNKNSSLPDLNGPEPENRFFRALKQYEQLLERAVSDPEKNSRRDMELFMCAVEMAHILIEKMHELYPEITDERPAPTKGYIREAAARNPEIHKDCWIKFMDIRFRLVHTADSQVPVEELTETIIPEFVREYKVITQ